MFILLFIFAFNNTALSQTADDKLPSNIVRYIDASARYRDYQREVYKTLPDELKRKMIMSRSGRVVKGNLKYHMRDAVKVGEKYNSTPSKTLVHGAWEIYRNNKLQRYIYADADAKKRQVIRMRELIKQAKMNAVTLKSHEAHVVPIMDPSNASEGDVGKFDATTNKYEHYEAFQIVNNREILVRAFNQPAYGDRQEGPLMWVTGYVDAGLSDGDEVYLGQNGDNLFFQSSTKVFECVGRHEYTTALGTAKSVIEFKQVNIGGYIEQIENALVDRDTNNN